MLLFLNFILSVLATSGCYLAHPNQRFLTLHKPKLLLPSLLLLVGCTSYWWQVFSPLVAMSLIITVLMMVLIVLPYIATGLEVAADSKKQAVIPSTVVNTKALK